jgi:hypothetical protein
MREPPAKPAPAVIRSKLANTPAHMALFESQNPCLDWLAGVPSGSEAERVVIDIS